MRKAIPAVLLSAVGFVAVWQYKPSLSSEPVALPAPPAVPTQLPSPPSSPTGAAPVETKTVSGSAERNSHGTVQVQVTFTGGRISAVTFLQLPNTATSKMAGPRLVQKTLQAQSADVDTVAGATQTSKSYVDSLQAAIDAKGT